jgi:hypothetical protein
VSCPTPSGLQAYLDGVARGDDKDAIRTHLEACVDCRALVLALAPDMPAELAPGMTAESEAPVDGIAPTTLVNLNRPAEGERTMRHAIAIYQTQLPPAHPDLLMARYVLAGSLMEQHRFDDAATLLHELVPLAEQQRGELPFLRPEIDWLLGRVELAHGRSDAAIALLEHSITAQHDPGMRAEAQLTLGKALWDARRDRRRAVALVREARGPLGAHPLSQKLADDWLATHAGN